MLLDSINSLRGIQGYQETVELRRRKRTDALGKNRTSTVLQVNSDHKFPLKDASYRFAGAAMVMFHMAKD